ncbi:MAG: BTAD domain-containing putative transcriptional regulator [Halioglobus sp.]
MNSRSNRRMKIEIAVLGGFSLSVGGEAVNVSAQKSKALLAWLACHIEQPQPRDRLAALLWADRTTANAKTSLRQAVAGLRKLLPEGALIAQGEHLALDVKLFTSDIEQFRRWREADGLEALRGRVGRYRGELLDGFNARSDAFDEWLLLEREALRREALAGFDQWLGQEEAAGNLAQAVTVGGHMIAMDPLQEALHRRLMTLYAKQGQVGSARRQFSLCRDVLHKELGIPPAPETVALFNALPEVAGEKSAANAANAARDTAVAAKTVDVADRRAALPSIAVLPFRSMLALNEHEYLADGMTEELISLLGNSANWQVTARNLSFKYRDKETDIRTVGTELGVAYAVEGSIRSMGERVRISVALISTSDGTQIWSERYDRPLAELFDVQDEVVHAIFRTLKNRLGFAERERVRRTPTTNLDAWGLLMKAMQVNVVGDETQEEQLALVREALAIEPDYPRAHAYLAMVLFTAVGRGAAIDPGDYVAQASKHAEAALNKGASDPVVLKMCAGGLAAVGQPERALKLAESAFELTGAADALWVAVLMWNGRLEEARRYCDDIVAATPANVPSPPGELRPQALLGNLKMLQGDLAGALESALRDQRSNPGNFFVHVNLANVHGLMGEQKEAQDAWDLAKAMLPSLTVSLFAAGYRNVFANDALADKFSEGLVKAGLEPN